MYLFIQLFISLFTGEGKIWNWYGDIQTDE
jgi:hypothetical protein